VLRCVLLKFLHGPAGASGEFRFDQQVKKVRHEDPANQEKFHLCAKLPKDLKEHVPKPRAVHCASPAVALEAANPMTFDEEAEKFQDNAAYAKWSAVKAKAIVDMVRRLDEVPDVRALTALFTSQ
jgi:hypothetical protein